METVGTLTPTQQTIMRLLVEEGMTQKQIALQLGRDLVTVKRHAQAIRKRLGGVTLHQAVAIAVMRGWVSIPSARRIQAVTMVTTKDKLTDMQPTGKASSPIRLT